MIFNAKVFVKSVILKKKIRLVRFWIKIFSSCRILNQIFYNASDFKQFT